HRDVESAHQLRELGRGVRPLHAAANVEQRLLAFFYCLDGALDLTRIPLEGRLEAAQIDFVRVLEMMLVLVDVLGYVNHYGTRAPGARDVESFLDDTRHIAHVFYEIVVLGAGPRDANDVGLLKGVVADHGGRHLPGYDDQR